ncbi:acetylesterase [Sporanaerobium hydrogeniformans]|uniref:Acetylesterase n=1 Tax=Sporanaerobium hydrogeniformans TaxID=3072179 RepID=A0AC61DFX7_9FIRM|nr:acetylxylan esterase [Sporanaerobium hydrogeniformans]PHV71693.1 acetylesterase [Sporanaerobium hydrogeniformans]
MPALDMPLEELKCYNGKSPKPQDFDTYWEKALKEMQAIDPQIELIPAPFTCDFAECFDLYFIGVKGARIHAKYLRPKNRKQKAPAILQFHGYKGDAGAWYSKLGLVAEGYCVAALDCRGQAGKSEDVGGVTGGTVMGHIIRGIEDDPQELLFRHIFLDTAQLAQVVMSFEEVDETRVAAMGSSQGGALTIACASLVPEIKLALSTYPFLADYKRVWEMDMTRRAYEELHYYFRTRDPRHEREEEIFYKLGYIDIQNLCTRIKAKVIMYTGLIDDICPPSTQFAVYNKILSKKEHIIYPDFGHEYLPDSDDMNFKYLKEILEKK